MCATYNRTGVTGADCQIQRNVKPNDTNRVQLHFLTPGGLLTELQDRLFISELFKSRSGLNCFFSGFNLTTVKLCV